MRGLVRFAVFQLLASVLLLSSVASAQETVCVQCHSGLADRLGEPVSLWRGSIHFHNGVYCFNCHGGDPVDFGAAHSPERGFLGAPEEEEIPDFCGRCHVGVREDYLESLHGQALGAGGPTCVTCHGSHAVRRATLDIINPQDCSRCHDYGRAGDIRAAMALTEGMISDLEGSLASLHRIGLDTTTLEGRVFSVRNSFHRLFHSVDVERVRGETAQFQEELAQIGRDVQTVEEELTRRKLWGGAAVLLLLVAAALAFMLHKAYMEDKSTF